VSGTETSLADNQEFGDVNSKFDGWASMEEPATIDLLKASAPKLVRDKPGCYELHMRRASLKQRYGVAFDAAETSDRRLCAITCAEDLPHIGIGKGDQLVAINGMVPNSVGECRDVLEKAMAIHLVLQRKQSTSNRASDKGVVAGSLLSVTKAIIIDARIGEFRLTIHRGSLKQRFGLIFQPVQPKRRGEELSIFVAEDMPHLSLKRCDRVVSLNGVRVRSKKVCSQILGSAMSLSLVMRREKSSLQHLAHQVEPIGDDKVSYEVPHDQPALCGGDCQDVAANWERTAPADGEVLGFDAMGGSYEVSQHGCGLLPVCSAPNLVDAEHIDFDSQGNLVTSAKSSDGGRRKLSRY